MPAEESFCLLAYLTACLRENCISIVLAAGRLPLSHCTAMAKRVRISNRWPKHWARALPWFVPTCHCMGKPIGTAGSGVFRNSWMNWDLTTFLRWAIAWEQGYGWLPFSDIPSGFKNWCWWHPTGLPSIPGIGLPRRRHWATGFLRTP